MSLPTFKFEVAFVNGPFDAAPTFVDLAADLDVLSVSRGRQTEADVASTGNVSGTLLDTVRAYDPLNTAGTYYPNVQPMKQLRVRATLGATTYPVFLGWIDLQDGWVRTEGAPGAATVHVPANDGFDVLDNSRVVTLPAHTPGFAFGAQRTDQRIAQALGNASGGCDPNWPAALRSLSVGFQNMQAYTSAAGDSPLAVIRMAETTEPGFFYFDGAGNACFRNRTDRLTAVSAATFCDKPNAGSGGVLVDSYTTRRSPVYNDVIVTASGGVPQEAVDPASIAQFITHKKDFSTQHVTDSDALGMAQFLLAQYKDSFEILESLTIVPGTDTTVWTQVLSRELNDRITVVRTPTGGGASVTEDYFIESINLNWGPGPSASCTWRLSRVDATAFWILGDATFGVLGVTTRFGF